MGLVPGLSAFCPFGEDYSRAEIRVWLRWQRLRKGRNADMEGGAEWRPAPGKNKDMAQALADASLIFLKKTSLWRNPNKPLDFKTHSIPSYPHLFK